jgi:flagellar M-ring protein FliF
VIRQSWTTLEEKFGVGGRLGLVAGAALIVLATVVAGFWLLRTDYQVLFADLTPQDAGAMTAELDRLKIPYTLSDQGNNAASILVDRNEVYKTRIKLMGKDIPLHGAVGFELFNNSDFGMTEFAQKITYQRALQGELTRTILSLNEIRDARVLLAMPEQGLFKQASARPKASVTLTLKNAQVLRPEQVGGIQRLVAAAVPGIGVQDVTIIDQNGVALTRTSGEGEADSATGSARLEFKKDTESYLARKASDVLERALGPGQAIASVDVTLNMDRVQSSTDETLGAPSKSGATPTGVVTRERETTREVGAPLVSRNAVEANGSAAGTSSGSSQREVEYAVGRRVEQVISQPGSIRRIQVAVVVRSALGLEQQEHLRKIIAATVGVSAERGDSVVVQTLEGLSSSSQKASAAVDPSVPTLETTQPRVVSPPAGPARLSSSALATALAIVLVGLFIVLAGWLLSRRGSVRLRAERSMTSLTDAERHAALGQITAWMNGRPDVAGSAAAAAAPAAGGVR